MSSNVVRIAEDFGKAAPAYEQHAVLQRAVAKELVAFADIIAAPKEPILDVGCGTGFVAAALGERIMQLDAAEAMCDLAQRYGETTVGDMHKMPFKDDSYQTIFSSMTTQWSDNIEKLYAEFARVLAPEGHLFLSLPLEGTLDQLEQALASIAQHKRMLSFYSLDDIKEAAAKAGLRVSEYEIAPKTIYHADLKNLLDSIRKIGAGNKHDSREEPLTRAEWNELVYFFESRFRHTRGLPATWNIGYLMVEHARD